MLERVGIKLMKFIKTNSVLTLDLASSTNKCPIKNHSPKSTIQKRSNYFLKIKEICVILV